MTSFLYGDFLWFPDKYEFISYSLLSPPPASLLPSFSPLPLPFPSPSTSTTVCTPYTAHSCSQTQAPQGSYGLVGPAGPPLAPASLLSLFPHRNHSPHSPQHTVGCFTSTPGQTPPALQSLSGALPPLRRLRWPFPTGPPHAGTVSTLGSQAFTQPLPMALCPLFCCPYSSAYFSLPPRSCTFLGRAKSLCICVSSELTAPAT